MDKKKKYLKTEKEKMSPEELGRYLAKIFARQNIFPSTKNPIDAVKMIEEEWGD